METASEQPAQQYQPLPQEGDPFRSKKEITRTFYGSEMHDAGIKPNKKKGEGGGISDLSMRYDLQQRRVEHSPVQQQPTPGNPNNESPAQLAMKRKRDMIAGIHDESTFVITQLPSKGGHVRQDEASEAAEQRRLAQQRYQEELRAQIEQRNQLRAGQQKRPYVQEDQSYASQRGSVLQERQSMMQQRESQYQQSQYQSQRGSIDMPEPGPRLLQRPLQTAIRPIATETSNSPSPQRYDNYEPLQVMAGASRDHTPTRPQQYFNPQNVLLFQKINSFIDIEMQQLRTQAQSQQKMMLLQLQNLHSEASRIRFEATNHLQTLQQRQEDAPTQRVSGRQSNRTLIAAGESILNTNSKSALDKVPSARGYAYEPNKYIQTQSKMYPLRLNDTYVDRQQNPIMISQTPQYQSPVQPKVVAPEVEEFDKDDAFAVLREIEKMTEQNEVDMQRYQNYTEKRYNTERFLEEMELRKDFPGLGVEQEDLLRRYDAKAEGKKLEYSMLRGKDIVFELLEQSLVHENLDKVRRDLDEFSYKNKDSSYLLSLPYMNPSTRQPIVPIAEKPKTPEAPKPETPPVSQEAPQPEKSALIKLHQLPVLDLSQAPAVDDEENLLYTLGDPPMQSAQESQREDAKALASSEKRDNQSPPAQSLAEKLDDMVARQDAVAFELPMDEPSPERNMEHIKSAEKLPHKPEEEYEEGFESFVDSPGRSPLASPKPESNLEHIKSASRLSQEKPNPLIQRDIPDNHPPPKLEKSVSQAAIVAGMERRKSTDGLKMQASRSRYDTFNVVPPPAEEAPDEIMDTYE